jgi:citrate synthase
MQWKTALSQVNKGQEIIRGYNLHELVQKKTFVEVIFLILRGQLPTAAETRMLNAVLAIMIDHGI